MDGLTRSRIQRITLPPFDPLNRRAAELRAQGHHVISLGQAVPFFPPPESALQAARAALATPEVNRYVTDPGLPSLRGVLAERLAEVTGTEIGADDLIITAGANHAFTLALTTVVDPGDEVILPAPYFTNHQMAVCALGAIPIEAPVADRATFSVRWSDVEPHLTSRTRALVLCNPSNPTGVPIDPKEGARLVHEAAARGLVVISDETYMHFVYEGAHWSAASVAEWRRNVVVIGTFSKSFGMMGWRVGFVLADASVCEQAVKVQDAMIICAPAISQMMAEGAVRHDWFYATSFHAELRERRRVLAEGLATIPGAEWAPSRGGLFAFVRFDGCSDSTRLSNDLLERAHVVTIPGAAFGASGEGCLRLSYGYANVADLSEAVTRLRDFFAAIRS
jgi:aspartate/methionine/tyrosine aminotransferase